MARSSPLILLCVGLVVVGLYVLSGGVEAIPPTVQQRAGGGEQCMGPPAPVPGLPRAWETGIPVSTYSIANSRDANLITVIPIIGWTGRGPDVNIVLYHNSSAVDFESMGQFSLGVDLGPGWSMSYSAHLLFTPGEPNKVTLVADDGARNIYTKVAGNWIAPIGVHDILTENGSTWTLTRKDQSRLEFEGNSLVKVISPCSTTGDELEITITKGSRGSPTTITDAGGRKIELQKVQFGPYYRLAGISSADDENTCTPGFGGTITRSWGFQYVGTGPTKITDPVDGFISLDYDTQGRITSLTDRKLSQADPSHTYTYTYYLTHHAIVRVLDPSGGASQLDQRFVVSCDGPGNRTVLTYTDRRRENWLYEYRLSERTPKSITNPAPLSNTWTFQYDGDSNMTRYTDPLSNDWNYTYDDRGNLETATDPLLHTQTWTYNAENSVRFYTDALGNQTELVYQPEPGCTTLVTEIKEPNEAGVPAITTTSTYHGPGTDGQAMLSSVTDPEGVLTTFEYDACGQLAMYGEGDAPGCAMYLRQKYSADVRSRVRQSNRCVVPCPGACPGGPTTTYNDVDQPTSSSCDMSRGGGNPLRLPSTFPALPNAPAFDAPYAEVWGITYDGLGQLTDYPAVLHCEDCGQSGKSRVSSAEFNELGLKTRGSVQTSELAGPQDLRSFAYTPNLLTGESTRVGPDGPNPDAPDGVETYVARDDAGRVSFVRRGPAGAPIMEADYSYYVDGRVWTIVYGNFASVLYQYDNARRLTRIEHRDPGNPILSLDYIYTNRDEIATITEESMTWGVTETTFTYDARGRLTHEIRNYLGPQPPHTVYDLTYDYDDAGNRLKKIDAVNELRVDYTYDIADPALYGSANNRLMFYETFDTSGGGDVLQSTTWYYYNDDGNVTRIVSSDDNGLEHFVATRFDYAVNGQTVSYIVGEKWDGLTSPTDYGINYAREFRYDGARQRYLVRELDKDAMMEDPKRYAVLSDTWSDYDGDDIYGDFTVSAGAATPIRSFEPGMGKFDWMDDGFRTQVPDDTTVGYYHTSHLGTTRVMTDSVGAPTGDVVYTAFGERIDGTNHRYGYAGAHGYQAHTIDEVPPPHDPDTVFPYLHVGHRYYDPATGRFLQRDPIGLWGGPNVYGYIASRPTRTVDPSGLSSLNPASLAYAGFSVAEIADILGMSVASVAAAIATKQLAESECARRPLVPKKPGRKKQGREQRRKSRRNPKFKPRNPPREPPQHTPSRKDQAPFY